jgi:hypothetical protein
LTCLTVATATASILEPSSIMSDLSDADHQFNSGLQAGIDCMAGRAAIFERLTGELDDINGRQICAGVRLIIEALRGDLRDLMKRTDDGGDDSAARRAV